MSVITISSRFAISLRRIKNCIIRTFHSRSDSIFTFVVSITRSIWIFVISINLAITRRKKSIPMISLWNGITMYTFTFVWVALNVPFTICRTISFTDCSLVLANHVKGRGISFRLWPKSVRSVFTVWKCYFTWYAM